VGADNCDHLNPPDDEVESAVGRIYDARSGNLHAGDPFPSGVWIGVSPQIKVRDLPLDILGRHSDRFGALC